MYELGTPWRHHRSTVAAPSRAQPNTLVLLPARSRYRNVVLLRKPLFFQDTAEDENWAIFGVNCRFCCRGREVKLMGAV